ncbi:uncharacterized protein LOC111287753 [Durio zibethinus]|uniref:Uncharacterized protein LOC111287753 n=1 Tax=Durio zibethinus TaxID=66656 RepID=A0A6P5Y163_DURZI|nr:uncharacterized protein LOC111287753 [Durio zibethinus]
MDKITANYEKLTYAKIYVEIAANVDSPRFIDVILRDGPIASITVEIPWMPSSCLHCNMFGHTEKACLNKSVAVETKVWQPKQQTAEPDEVLDKEATEIGKWLLQIKAGSVNRHAILDTLDDKDRGRDVVLNTIESSMQEMRTEASSSPKKISATSVGVAKWMKERRRLWKNLITIQNTLANCPWILTGDFNVIAHPREIFDYDGSQVPSISTREFQDCIRKIEVTVHLYVEPLFTWGNHTRSRKLDRVLINYTWLIQMSNLVVEFLLPEVSNHYPALIKMNMPRQSPSKPSKLFNFWTKHPQFMRLVEKF